MDSNRAPPTRRRRMYELLPDGFFEDLIRHDSANLHVRPHEVQAFQQSHYLLSNFHLPPLTRPIRPPPPCPIPFPPWTVELESEDYPQQQQQPPPPPQQQQQQTNLPSVQDLPAISGSRNRRGRGTERRTRSQRGPDIPAVGDPNGDDQRRRQALSNGDISPPPIPPHNPPHPRDHLNSQSSPPLPTPPTPPSAGYNITLNVGLEPQGHSLSRRTGTERTRESEQHISSRTLDTSEEDVDMPAPRQRRIPAATAAASSSAAQPSRGVKRRRSGQIPARSAPDPSSGQTTGSLPQDHDVFGSDDRKHKDVDSEEQEIEVINLADADNVPEALLQPKVANSVKLGAFQCVICMDDVKDLTVTHCGHLFCSGCLHSSLHIDATKKVCPICRQKIDRKNPGHAFAKTSKGFYPLELKLMTRRRNGKRAA